MKLGPVTKLYKRNTATSKKLDDDVLSANYDAIVILRFMSNLEQFRSRISDAWSAEIDKIKEVLVLKGTFSETTMFVYSSTIVQVSSIIPVSFRQRVVLTNLCPIPQNKPLKRPPRLGLNDSIERFS